MHTGADPFLDFDICQVLNYQDCPGTKRVVVQCDAVSRLDKVSYTGLNGT